MLQLKPRTRTHTPPAKSWRNYYRAYHMLNLGRGWWSPGVNAGPDTFPSKEIAEEHAQAFLRLLNPPGRWLADFAGAYPEGEAPN